ncbi:MAG: putative addiction module antidote protein [Elusimicrobiaceae bacterium]|nr:putative addiction module antidote protein [Elusimicrobiaceae bacterium]
MIKLNKKQKKNLSKFRDFEEVQVSDLKKNPELMLSYLNNALEDYKVHKNIAILNNALQIIARAIGMTKISKEAKLGRTGLYNSFKQDGNPSLYAFLAVLNSAKINLKATL